MSKVLNSPIGVGVMCLIAIVTLLKNTGALSALGSDNKSKPKSKKVVSVGAEASTNQPPDGVPGDETTGRDASSEERKEFLKEELDRIATAKNKMFNPAESRRQEEEADEAPPAKDVLDLKATLLELRASYAVINGRALTIGESIEGFTIREIASGTVYLDGPSGPDSIYIWDE